MPVTKKKEEGRVIAPNSLPDLKYEKGPKTWQRSRTRIPRRGGCRVGYLPGDLYESLKQSHTKTVFSIESVYKRL